jgi:Ca2+/Na+ antiporter
LPYFLANLIKGKEPEVQTSDLVPSVVILYGVLAAVLLILWRSNWWLNPKVGVSLFALYFLYVIFAYSYGLS